MICECAKVISHAPVPGCMGVYVQVVSCFVLRVSEGEEAVGWQKCRGAGITDGSCRCSRGFRAAGKHMGPPNCMLKAAHLLFVRVCVLCGGGPVPKNKCCDEGMLPCGGILAGTSWVKLQESAALLCTAV